MKIKRKDIENANIKSNSQSVSDAENKILKLFKVVKKEENK